MTMEKRFQLAKMSTVYSLIPTSTLQVAKPEITNHTFDEPSKNRRLNVTHE